MGNKNWKTLQLIIQRILGLSNIFFVKKKQRNGHWAWDTTKPKPTKWVSSSRIFSQLPEALVTLPSSRQTSPATVSAAGKMAAAVVLLSLRRRDLSSPNLRSVRHLFLFLFFAFFLNGLAFCSC